MVAEDKDAGANGDIYYSLSPSDHALFDIDAATGQISTKARLTGRDAYANHSGSGIEPGLPSIGTRPVPRKFKIEHRKSKIED